MSAMMFFSAQNLLRQLASTFSSSIAKHGNVEELAAEERPAGRLPVRPNGHAPRQSEPAEFKRLLTELHVVSLNRAKAENNVCLDLLFRLAILKFQRTELLNQYGQVLDRCRSPGEIL